MDPNYGLQWWNRQNLQGHGGDNMKQMGVERELKGELLFKT